MNAACMLYIKHAETFFLKGWTPPLDHYDLVMLRGSLFSIDLLEFTCALEGRDQQTLAMAKDVPVQLQQEQLVRK